MAHYSITETKAYVEATKITKQPKWEVVQQLGSKQAWIVKDVANGFVALQSYNTIVSVKINNEVVDLGKWSPTTSRHQSLFRRLA